MKGGPFIELIVALLVLASCESDPLVRKAKLSGSALIPAVVLDSIYLKSFDSGMELPMQTVLRDNIMYYTLAGQANRIYEFNFGSQACTVAYDFRGFPPRGFNDKLLFSFDEREELVLLNTQEDVRMEIDFSAKDIKFIHFPSDEHHCSMSYESARLFTRNDFLIVRSSCYISQQSSEFIDRAMNFAICDRKLGKCVYKIPYPEYYKDKILPVNALVDVFADMDQDSLFVVFSCFPEIFKFYFTAGDVKLVSRTRLQSSLIKEMYRPMSGEADGFEEYLHHYKQGFYGPIFHLKENKWAVFVTKSIGVGPMQKSPSEIAENVMYSTLFHVLIIENGTLKEYKLPYTSPQESFVHDGLLYIPVQSDIDNTCKFLKIDV